MNIHVIDHLDPETTAMLQALLSRSPVSVVEHLKKVSAERSAKFMERYYVDYNHQSIADCGSTTIFVELVSLLAAKAIQDWPLYCGQETSTRFLDMSRQPLIVPPSEPWIQAVQARWMSFYEENQERVAEAVRAKHPRRPEEPEDKYEAAVKARKFDVLRGFLPAGICTQLSWHTNLRQAADHLTLLRHHPMEEVRTIAAGIGARLAAKYPSTAAKIDLAGSAGVTGVTGGAQERAAWYKEAAAATSYLEPDTWAPYASSFNRSRLSDFQEILATRPRGAVLPHALTDEGQFCFRFELDFGSFRDLQRHRNGVCRMPLLTCKRGFEPWYVEQLDAYLQGHARKLIADQTRAIDTAVAAGANPAAAQLAVALGFRVGCQVTYSLPAVLYVLEARSGKTIHPTLRKVVHDKMIAPFRQDVPSFVALHVDEDPDDWSLRRGQQTITERSTGPILA